MCTRESPRIVVPALTQAPATIRSRGLGATSVIVALPTSQTRRMRSAPLAESTPRTASAGLTDPLKGGYQNFSFSLSIQI